MSAVYLKLFVDCLEKYQKLNDTEFGRLVRAALRYKATGAEPDDLGREALLWDGMRLDIDRDNEAYASLLKARSEAGKLGGRPRKANAFDEKQKKQKVFLESKKSQDKDKEEEKDITPHTPQGDRAFDMFWSAYPRKIGKEKARTSFKTAMKKATLETMLAAIEAQKQSDQWQRDGGQYIPHPSTWLNQGRWEDEVTERGRQDGTERLVTLADLQRR